MVNVTSEADLQIQFVLAEDALRKHERKFRSAHYKRAAGAVVMYGGMALLLLLGRFHDWLGLLSLSMIVAGMAEWFVSLIQEIIAQRAIIKAKRRIAYLESKLKEVYP